MTFTAPPGSFAEPSVGHVAMPLRRGVLKGVDFFLCVSRTALRDRPKGPSTSNHHPPPPANRHQPPTTANRQWRPTASRQQPAANHYQPLSTTNPQRPTAANHHQPPPTANRQPRTRGVPAGLFGEPVYRNSFFFPSRTALPLHFWGWRKAARLAHASVCLRCFVVPSLASAPASMHQSGHVRALASPAAAPVSYPSLCNPLPLPVSSSLACALPPSALLPVPLAPGGSPFAAASQDDDDSDDSDGGMGVKGTAFFPGRKAAGVCRRVRGIATRAPRLCPAPIANRVCRGGRRQAGLCGRALSRCGRCCSRREGCWVVQRALPCTPAAAG